MRCPWSEQTESMRQYHDTVWGVPEHDDQKAVPKIDARHQSGRIELADDFK